MLVVLLLLLVSPALGFAFSGSLVVRILRFILMKVGLKKKMGARNLKAIPCICVHPKFYLIALIDVGFPQDHRKLNYCK